MKSDKYFMSRALELAEYGMENNHGGPFGAVVVRNNKIIGEGFNKVLSSNDPSAHAEIVAIRNACENISDYQLTDAVVFTTCEPCPMCLGAIYWARPDRIVMASSREDASDAGFDDSFIYKELDKEIDERNIPIAQLMQEESKRLFRKWVEKEDKKLY